MEIKVLHNQNLFDLAIQHSGTAENAFALALANGISVTDELEAGASQTMPVVQVEKDILEYYTAKGVKPATHSQTEIHYPEGINYWIIEETFTVQ